jgi:hypothetical protein
MILLNKFLIFKQTFFDQHNCITKDSQQKYNSRAALLYREKLHQAAVKAQRNYGNKVNLIKRKMIMSIVSLLIVLTIL